MYKQISFNQSDNKQHSIFLTLIFNNSSLFFINRWVGRLGSPGRKVDQRELQEEINFISIHFNLKYFSCFQETKVLLNYLKELQ